MNQVDSGYTFFSHCYTDYAAALVPPAGKKTAWNRSRKVQGTQFWMKLLNTLNFWLANLKTKNIYIYILKNIRHFQKASLKISHIIFLLF